MFKIENHNNSFIFFWTRNLLVHWRLNHTANVLFDDHLSIKNKMQRNRWMKENRKNIISPSQISQIIATLKMMKNDFPSLHIIQKYYFPLLYCKQFSIPWTSSYQLPPLSINSGAPSQFLNQVCELALNSFFIRVLSPPNTLLLACFHSLSCISPLSL